MKVLFVLALLACPAFAQDSAAAMELYNKGVKQLDAGKGDDARKSFETIVKELSHQRLRQARQRRSR